MKKILKRGMSGLLAVLMAFTVLAGFGTTTAFAASETAESYMISFPVTGRCSDLLRGRMGTLRQKLYEWLGNRLQQLHHTALYGFL